MNDFTNTLTTDEIEERESVFDQLALENQFDQAAEHTHRTEIFEEFHEMGGEINGIEIDGYYQEADYDQLLELLLTNGDCVLVGINHNGNNERLHFSA